MINKVGLLPNIEIELKSTEKKAEEVQKKELLSSIENKENTENTEKTITKSKVEPTVTSYKALWVIDDKNNVFIRIEDEKGNVIRQIPPEEIINLKERMNEILKNLFKIEV